MGDFSSYNNGEAELPHSVQQLIIQICKKERKGPPDDEARGLLLALGEERSLWILKEIWKYTIKKNLSAFIAFMAKEYYPSETQQFYQKQNYERTRAITSVNSSMKEQEHLQQVCAGLSLRLQEYKSENAQLEELLVAERELSKSCEARIKQLQKDLSAAEEEVLRAEFSMAEALAAKNAEIEALVSSMYVVKKQAALSEGNLASLQSLMTNRELAVTRMMQALKEELGAAERRSEEERAAHNAAKEAFKEREVELEHRALEASTAWARAQRIADERTAKATELEQKVALLEVECAKLNQELQDMEARTCLGQKKSSEEANQVLQAWQEEMERAHQGQREAESKYASLEAEMQKLRIETAAMKRDAEHYCRQQVSGSLEGTAAGESKSEGIGLDTFQRGVQKKQKREVRAGARCWGALLGRCPRPQISKEQIGCTTGALHQEAFSRDISAGALRVRGTSMKI